MIKNKFYIDQKVWFKHPYKDEAAVMFRISTIGLMYDAGKCFLIYGGTDGRSNIENIREDWLYPTKEKILKKLKE